MGLVPLEGQVPSDHVALGGPIQGPVLPRRVVGCTSASEGGAPRDLVG